MQDCTNIHLHNKKKNSSKNWYKINEFISVLKKMLIKITN